MGNMSMKVLSVAVLSAALVMAAGCSKSSVSGGTENSSSTERSSGIEKKMDVSQQQQAAIEVKEPAVPILVSALRKIIAVGEPNSPANSMAYWQLMANITPYDKMGLIPTGNTFGDSVLASVVGACDAPGGYEKRLQKVAAGSGLDAEIAKLKLGAMARNRMAPCGHDIAATAVIFSVTPIQGWYGTPNEEKYANQAKAYGENVQFANLLLTRLYYSLPKTALSGHDAAIVEIAKALYGIPSDQLDTMWGQAQKMMDHGITINATGSIPDGGAIGYYIGGATYTGGQSGMSITQNGVKWFGDGRISGKEVTLSFTQNTSRGLSQSKSLGQSSKSSVSTKTHEEANVAGQGG
jgi:hypothetical protein